MLEDGGPVPHHVVDDRHDRLPGIGQPGAGGGFADEEAGLVGGELGWGTVEVREGFDHADAGEIDFVVDGAEEEGL